MDDLVKEFQKVVSGALAPQSMRGAGAGKVAAFRRQVVTACRIALASTAGMETAT